jgi:hypothetical protein
MAAPSQPTKTTIVTEALTRFFNGATPEAADITRAEEYGLEKVKRDIMSIGRTWRPLLRTAYDITIAGVSHYANPPDFDSNYSVGYMSGNHSGALDTVTSTSIVDLAAAEDITQAQAEGKWLLITSGTGVDQARIIDDYNTTTKRATMASAFTTLPVTGDGYLVVDSIYSLRDMKSIALYDRYQHPGISGTPARYINIPNDTTGDLALYPVPDSVGGLQRRYYADLMLVDITSDLYSTILRRWAGVFEQGVYVWKLGEDDDRYPEQNVAYQSMLIALMANDMDGVNRKELKSAITGGSE